MATSCCPTLTLATKFVQESAWALMWLHCMSVGGSEQAVVSTSCLCEEPTLCVQSCLLLDSEASVELGEAEISDNAEFFGSPRAVTDDHKTHRDCLIDSQCKSPSSERPDTLALHCNSPYSVHIVTLITIFCKRKLFFPACAYTPLPMLFTRLWVAKCMHLINNAWAMTLKNCLNCYYYYFVIVWRHFGS